MTEPQKSFKELPEGAVLEPPKSFKELPEGALLESPKSFKELPEDAVLEDDLSIDEIKKMQSEGVPLSEKLQRKLFDAEDERGLLDKAAGAASAFLPAAADIIGQTASGAVELANKAVVQPAAFALSGGYNRLDSEEAKKVFKDREEALRSVAVGAAKDVEETANAAVRAIYFGTGVTDKLLGKSKEERFRRWQDRQAMRDLEAKSLEENPDRAAYLLSQNPLIQGYVEYEAKKMGLSPEEVEKVKQDYIQSMLDQGLTKEQINQNIAALGEFISPVSVPGAGKLSDVALKPLSKVTAPVMNKAAELAVRGTSKLAQGTEYAANKVLQGTELLQTGARKIGEYAINDPDTWIKGTVNTAIMPVVGVAKPVSATARVIRDITNIDIGGTAGRKGMVEMAGQRIDSSDLTKRLFGPQGKGGVARAKLADWTIRQSNALIQPGVNAAAMNVVMGLPDIETAEDLGFSAGTGFGIGSLAGVRSYDRLSGLVDPRKTMAEKITNFVTPDPAAYRRDEDADIKRFMAQATPDIQQNITDLADIEKRKAAVDATIASLEKERDAQIDPDDAAFKQTQIDGFLKQKEALSKATPETQAEALRQTQLAFIDAYDLAQSTGGVAGLRGVNIAVLDSANADQFFRDLYGDSLKQAETTINLLTGMPSLTETDSQKLTEARQLIQKFQNDVEGAKTTRGFAIQEDNTDPNSPNFVPPHLRRINQVGATAVINADLIKHLSTQGFNVRHTLQHEVQHAVQQFAEVNKMLAPLRGQLFDQKIKNDDGTTEVYQQGIYSDEDLNRYAARYAKLMSPSDGGASFYAQFGGDSEKMRAYIKDEILAETAAATGEYAGGTRASLDDVGRNVMDWLEVKTKSGRLKQLKEALRRNGVIFDNVGAVSSVLDAQMSPETLAMVRQYQRGLKDFDGTMTVQQSRESDEPDIPLTKVLGSVALQNKYRHADFFEKEQIIKATAPDGSVTEIVIPKEAKIDPFIDVYRTQGGQLVDANGNVVTLGPEITFGSMPDGTTFEVDTRIARKSNGSPIILTNREMKSRALERTKMIQNAIDSAKDDGSGVRLSDTGNGNYRGVMSPAQIEAFMALPNYVVSPNLKRMTKFFNELMARNDGTRVVMEYQASLLNGRYKALSPKIRDEVPIGFQLTKDGNFALTTISVSRLYDKMQAWADKKPANLQPWNGDTGAFWDSVTKYLDNHAKGEKGETGLHPDAYIAGKMKNKINDLFNAYNAETKQSNPERSTLPRARGKDNLDIVIRSRRLDRINNFSESPSQKLPINYGYLTTNYMPAVNPMAAPMTAEEVQNRFDGSVTATRVRRAMATGEIDALESELRQMDDLLPTESLQLVQAEGEMPRIQIVSMFDPENVASLEPEEIVSDIDAETEAELAILDAQDGTVPPQDIAKVLSSKLDQLYADGGRSPIIPVLETELEKIYQQLESQAQEQAAATEDIVEAPETTEVDVMNSPTDLIAQAVDAYNTGKVDNETQTLPEYIRSVVDEAGILQIPPDVTDEQIAAAADDVVQYRESLKDRIQSGTQFSNAVVAPAGLQYLPAFHGTPYDFEKFRMDKIGSGEGAQAFGYGLYFSGARAVGEEYARVLANRDLSGYKNAKLNAKDIVSRLGGNADYAAEILRDELKTIPKNSQNFTRISETLKIIETGEYAKDLDEKGNLYKVDLDVDDADLLDWDKPLSEQSEKVQNAVLPTILSEFKKTTDAREYLLKRGTKAGGKPFKPEELERLKKPMPDPLSITGKAAYTYFVNNFGGRPSEDSPKASNLLLSRGVSGIRYFDAMSRGAGEGTYNYVIFDENLIKILEKNDQPVGPVTQFMPAVQTIPERFTGTGEKGEERRGRYVAPPEFWTRFDIGEFERGGKFFDIETGEDITDKTYATGTIDVTGKRPSLVSDSIIDEMSDGKGRTWKTNLFRKSAGWEWISENPPEVATIGSKEKPMPVLISVENNPDHFYALKVDFPSGVKLARYPEGGEPRLRPTKKGQIQFGNEIGRIKTAKKEHPVYDTITIGTKFMPTEVNYPSVGININSKTQDFTDQILRGEKTIETRPSNSLKSLIGKRVGIVRTGKGKATLVGYANIEEPIVYNNVEEFRADQDKHLVEAGSDFDIKPDQKKYGYPLTDVESIEPIEVPSNLPNWYSARSIPQTQFMPAENTAAFSDVPAPEAQQEVEKPLSMVRLSDAPEPPKKYAFAYTTSSDRIPLVDALVKAKNWQAIRDLNQATIRHAMSDLPNVKYTLKDLVGAFENEREISVMPEFEITSPEELAEVRKRMVSLGELWQQTEVLEEQVGGGDQNLLGTVDTDGYLHIGKATLTFDKLTPALVEKARQASGIQAMSYDNNSVIFYDTDNNPAEFERRVDRFTGFVTENGRVLEARTADSAKVRSYRNPNSPKAGSLYYNEDPIRLFGEGQLPDRLRSPVYRVVSELLGRVLPPPKDGRASYFVKEDVTPKQVKLQNAIAKKQEAVVLNDKKNKDVVKAYEELNAELLKQFDALVAGGMTFTAAPDYDVYNSLYPDSASVIRDIRNNNNLVYLKTTPETFGPVQNGKRMDFSFHPILKDSGRTDASGNKMSYNDILRVVHDAIAHGIYSAQFGPVGEESAWNTHIRTIDNPWARWALTMETRAQNSWVNYQDKFLTEKKTGEDRMPLKKGDKGFIPVSARDYAEQKFALIPLKYTLTGDAKVDKPVKDLMEEIGEKRAEGSPEKDPEWMPSKKEREKIYASIKQPQGTPKDLLKQASDVIGKLTRKDDAENVPVIVEKAWVEKKSKDEDAEDATDDSVEDGEVITTSTAVLKDVVVYSLRGTPIVVRPLPNLLAENVKTKVSKNVLAIAEDKKKYLEYSNRVLTAADKLRQDPEMFTTPSGYLQFMRESGASGNLLMPPSQIAQLVKDPNAILQLWQGGYHGKKTAQGTVAAAVAGLDSVNAMRDLFIQDGVNLGPTRMITALHHLWGILSRQLDPYNQEALWMRMVSYAPVMEQIQLSIDGKFKLTANEWKKIVQDARKATKGDYQKAGNNATANANAFHHMLSKHNGKWQELANIYKLSDPVEMTNAFWGLGVGATGIKNKVQRFIGLTFGIHGSVLDRWRFVGLNLPTAMGLTGKATPETYFNYYGRNKTIPEDPVGIYKSYGTVENGNPVFSTALYAGIDRTIQGVIDNSKEMRDFLGVHATPGGFHWVDWNCVKNEAVGHSSLDLTKEFLKRKGRNGTVNDFLDVVRTSTTFTRADQDGRIIDLVMKDGIFQVVEQK